MEEVTEIKVDYFLRYRSEIPADEVDSHKEFYTLCPCKPKVEFDEKEGWHHIVHNCLRK